MINNKETKNNEMVIIKEILFILFLSKSPKSYIISNQLKL